MGRAKVENLSEYEQKGVDNQPLFFYAQTAKITEGIMNDTPIDETTTDDTSIYVAFEYLEAAGAHCGGRY